MPSRDGGQRGTKQVAQKHADVEARIIRRPDRMGQEQDDQSARYATEYGKRLVLPLNEGERTLADQVANAVNFLVGRGKRLHPTVEVCRDTQRRNGYHDSHDRP